MKLDKIKHTIRRIFQLIAILAFVLLVFVSLGFTNHERKLMCVDQVEIDINIKENFVGKDEVKLLFDNQLSYIKGAKLDIINTERIEEIIEEHPWIKNAEVFLGYGKADTLFYAGKLKVKIEEKSPIARYVNGADGFYIGSEGEELPLVKHKAYKTLIITSENANLTISNDLLLFINFVNNNVFWKAQIVQVQIEKDGELILIPRVGEHQIEFGMPRKIESKFKNLKAVYEQGFTKTGWNKYKTINLRFENQVICSK